MTFSYFIQWGCLTNKKLSSLTFWLHRFENMKENWLQQVCTYLLPLNVTTSFKLLSSKINRVCRSMFWLYTLSILQATFHRFSGQCPCTHYISYNIHAKTAANTHKSLQEILRSDNYSILKWCLRTYLV